MDLSVTERYHAAVVTLRGEFVGTADAPAFHEALAAMRASGRTNVVAELSAVTFMDSSALGALIEAATTLRALGGDLRMAGMETTPRLVWMVSVFRLHDVFALHPSVEAAVESFAPGAPALFAEAETA